MCAYVYTHTNIMCVYGGRYVKFILKYAAVLRNYIKLFLERHHKNINSCLSFLKRVNFKCTWIVAGSPLQVSFWRLEHRSKATPKRSHDALLAFQHWALHYSKSMMGMSQKADFSKAGYIIFFFFFSYYFVKISRHTEKLNHKANTPRFYS